MPIFKNKAVGAELCPNQIAKEKIKKALKMHQAAYEVLGIHDYYLRLSKFANSSDIYVQVPDRWRREEGLLRAALMDLGFPFYEEEDPDNRDYARISFVHSKGFDLSYVFHRF
jgi:Threonyl-tRNA synthetase